MVDTTQADSLTSIVWSWGDNTFTKVTNCKQVSHKYKSAGVYKVALLLQHRSGCLGNDTMKLQVGYSHFFSPTVNQVCAGGNVTFYKYVNYWNNSKGQWYDTSRFNKGLESFKWDFGDGNGFSNSQALPTIQYAKMGNYKIQLATVDSAGCRDTSVYPILFKVFKINADFSTIRDSFICAQQVAFTSSVSTYDSLSGIVPYSGVVNSYKWTFGKGISNSSIANPSKFLKTGIYAVKLVIVTDQLCKDSIIKNIKIIGPKAYYEFVGDSTGCTPLKIKFKNKSTLAANFLWQFKDPTNNNVTFFTNSDSSVSWTYSAAGIVYPTLIASNNLISNGFPIACTSIFPDTPFIKTLRPVEVFGKPNMNFIQQIDCDNRIVSFASQCSISKGSIVDYVWEFGDGDTSHAINPKHTYNDTGSYVVTLTAITDKGCVGKFTKTVRVPKGPIVSFYKKDVCVGNSIQFIDSLGTFNDKVYYWDWYFDDGNFSNISNPLKKFSNPGKYSVLLKVYTLSGCTNSVRKSVWIHSRPKTNFTFTNKCLTDTIKFNNTTTSDENPLKYFWRLGNGDTSSKTSLNKAYKTAGNYSVKLLATNPFGCSDSITKTVITYPLPNASFKINYHTTCKNGHQFVFNNISTTDTGKLFYQWKFTNTDTSILKNPTYTYKASGKFTVRLIAKTNYNCRDTSLDTVYVNPNPVSNKAIIPSNTVCINGTQFKLIDNSSISSGSWTRKWYTGDNNTATDSILSYNYKDTGNFTVKLTTLSNLNCPDSILFKVRVSPKPKANFTINNPNQCVNGNLFAFTNASQGFYGSTTSRWQFGDGDSSLNTNSSHTYRFQDTFTVRLIATNTSGCKDTIKKDIIAYPKPSAQFTIKDTLPCEINNKILFKNSSTIAYGTLTHAWNFGDNKTANTLNTSHSYDTFGTYAVRLIATSNYGCKDTITKNATVYPMPMPAFKVNKQSQCLNSQNFIFTNLSTIGKDSFSSTWMLGEKDSVKTKNASKQFKTTATFKVSLILKSNKGCIDSTSMKVKIFPKPFPQYTVNDSTQCINGQAYNFTNTSTILSGGMTYSWTLGNGFKTISTPRNYRGRPGTPFDFAAVCSVWLISDSRYVGILETEHFGLPGVVPLLSDDGLLNSLNISGSSAP
jgi:PKD repeat protein